MFKKTQSKEDKPDFNDMMNEVEHEIETSDAEQNIIDRVPALNDLSNSIDKATNNVINAVLQLESAITQYQRAELKLGGAVNTISNKVDTINAHIDNVLKDAPTKLQVSVSVKSADMQKIQTMIDNHLKQVDVKFQKHIQEVNQMFADERKSVRERYKEYDGCYLGHYAQWFFWFFFTFGLIVFGFVVIESLNSHYHWF